MDNLLVKLNFSGQQEICVINTPKKLETIVNSFSIDARCITDLNHITKGNFFLIFVFSIEEIESFTKQIMGRTSGDPIIWFAYPKKSSKNYTCNFTRDTGWTILGNYHFESVKIVALDDDFSAIRFRNVKYIDKLTRSEEMALSLEAKNRIKKSNK
jgi:hypothetical protein